MVAIDLKAETFKLMDKRSSVETETNVIIDRLSQPGGLSFSGNLVDNEGFPRSDSDINIPAVLADRRHHLADSSSQVVIPQRSWSFSVYTNESNCSTSIMLGTQISYGLISYFLLAFNLYIMIFGCTYWMREVPTLITHSFTAVGLLWVLHLIAI